jgi:hypothetical protein
VVVVKTEIKCQSCQKEALHPIRALLEVDEVTCPFCRTPNNIAGQRSRIHALSEKYRAMEEFLGP